MPTGGFSPEAESIAAFGATVQWIVTAFMAAAGASFVLWYRVFRRSRRHLLRDEEFRVYVLVLVVVSLALAAILYLDGTYGSAHDALRHGAFQTVTIVTTTGYASADFALWIPLALIILFLLMFAGGSSGSTAGGPKIVRHMLAVRAVRREVQLASHPQLVRPIAVSGRTADERAVRAALVFLLVYVGVFAVGVVVLLADAAAHGRELTPFEALSAGATTITNIGPGVGFLGPYGSFEPFGDVSTGVMIVLMWMGRLELFPVLVLLTRSYWRR
jgi:trk system potassium uptake protein TrkH